MDYVHAIVLGLIQGVAELFPVSSAAHTLIISALLGWKPPSLPFVVMLHLGTFLAVLIYFAKDYWQLIVGFFTGFASFFREPAQRLALYVVLGSIPLAIAGKLLEKPLDPLFARPVFAAGFLLVTGLLLFLIERLRQGKGEAEGLAWWQAVLIGLSQVGGLVPGGSRSGFSIVAGMLARLTREQAARFSFLLAGPAILGASAFELRRIIHPKAGAPPPTGFVSVGAAPEHASVIALGFIVAFISGLFAIRFFMRYVDQHRLTPFAIYCWAFGLASLGLLLARQHG